MKVVVKLFVQQKLSGSKKQHFFCVYVCNKDERNYGSLGKKSSCTVESQVYGKSSVRCRGLKIEIPHFALWNYSSTPARADTETTPIIFLPCTATIIF